MGSLEWIGIGIVLTMHFACGLGGYGIAKEDWRKHFANLTCPSLGYALGHELGCWLVFLFGIWGFAVAMIRGYPGQNGKACFLMPRELKLSYRQKGEQK